MKKQELNANSSSFNIQSAILVLDQDEFQTLVETIAYTSPNLIPLIVFV